MSAYRASTSQASNSLGGHCLEDRGRQVRVRGALVQQRLQVGLGEHPAPRSDRVEVLVPGRELVEAAAGTGKTALMAGRLTMLLARGTEPGAIAATTPSFNHA